MAGKKKSQPRERIPAAGKYPGSRKEHFDSGETKTPAGREVNATRAGKSLLKSHSSADRYVSGAPDIGRHILR